MADRGRHRGGGYHRPNHQRPQHRQPDRNTERCGHCGKGSHSEDTCINLVIKELREVSHNVSNDMTSTQNDVSGQDRKRKRIEGPSDEAPATSHPMTPSSNATAVGNISADIFGLSTYPAGTAPPAPQAWPPAITDTTSNHVPPPATPYASLSSNAAGYRHQSTAPHVSYPIPNSFTPSLSQRASNTPRSPALPRVTSTVPVLASLNVNPTTPYMSPFPGRPLTPTRSTPLNLPSAINMLGSTMGSEWPTSQPPPAPTILPPVAGYVWTGVGWHGPVWTCALPSSLGAPGDTIPVKRETGEEIRTHQPLGGLYYPAGTGYSERRWTGYGSG
ncbi:hypothetical protein BJX76DRAFT_332905 [Aspergillus varians]